MRLGERLGETTTSALVWSDENSIVFTSLKVRKSKKNGKCNGEN